MLLKDAKGNRYQLEENPFGWLVTVHGPDGKLRYIGNAGDQYDAAVRCLKRARRIFAPKPDTGVNAEAVDAS